MKPHDALALIREGKVSIWNDYRRSNPKWIPNLSQVAVRGTLDGINLSEANIYNSTLAGSFIGASFWGADLRKSNLTAQLAFSCLSRADLRGANLSDCIFDKVIDSSAVSADDKWLVVEESTSVRFVAVKAAKIDIASRFPLAIDPVRGGALFVSSDDETGGDKSRVQIFISYAWANDDVVLAVDAWLRSKGLRTKLDKRDFFAGSRIRDEVVRVMSESQVILIFHSQASAQKPWPEFEREFAADLIMEAKKKKQPPPRTIYFVLDEVGLPNVSEQNKLAVMAKGKRFELVCEELYHSILQLPREPTDIDLKKWQDYVF